MSGRDAACTVQQLPAADGLVHTPLVQAISGMFLGDAGKADDTMANPLHADYAGFQRMYVDASSDVTLLDDSRRLPSRARAAGVDVAPSIVDHMQHVFPILEGRTEEADRELARVSNWYKSNDK